jgi:hypothetical protein
MRLYNLRFEIGSVGIRQSLAADWDNKEAQSAALPCARLVLAREWKQFIVGMGSCRMRNLSRLAVSMNVSYCTITLLGPA